MAILVGLIIGLVLGLTGAGGSLFAVPLLVVLLDMPMQQATGVALGAVSASALFGVLQRDSREIAWAPALIILLGGVLGAPAGRYLSQFLNELWLLLLFSALVLGVGARMWRQAKASPEQARVTRAGASSAENDPSRAYCQRVGQQWQLGAPCVAVAALGGLGTGVLSGVLGVGGGFVIVPLLTLVAGLSMQQAVASSLLIITLVSASGFASFWLMSGSLDITMLLLVSLGGVAGMLIGGRFSQKLAGPTLQQVFSGLLGLTLVAIWGTRWL